MFSKLLLKKATLTSTKGGSAIEALKKLVSNETKDVEQTTDFHVNDDFLRKRELKYRNYQFENGWNYLKVSSMCTQKDTTQFISNASVYDLKSNIIDLVSIKHEPQGIYGLQQLVTHKKADQLIICDSILNAFSLYESLNTPVLVFKTNIELKDQLKIQLERFNKIIIWLNDKNYAWDLAEQLNSQRCFLVSHSKTPFDCFKSNVSLKKIISSEQFSLKNEGLIQLKDIVSDVYDEVANLKKTSGTKWTRFPLLNEFLKGFRAGELTIFTGQTGTGKTTFLSEYSIDLCVNQVPTLWGSFEIKNSRLCKLMMTQYSGVNLTRNLNFFNDIVKEFSKLPMYFMNFHGEEQLENVIQTMSQAVILHGIRHVVIDNLQFMMGNQRTNAMDKFALQDLMISSFRKFATNFDCHVTLVIHPRKESDDELLKISSIFGTAKACQEADNILILQEKKVDREDSKTWFKFIEVCKNRYDGELGKMFLKFDKDRLSYFHGINTKSQRKSTVDDDKMYDVLNE